MTNDLTLYGITEEINALEEILLAEGGEVTEASEELIADVNQLIESKVDGVVGYIKKQNDLIAIAKDRKKEMDTFIKSKEKQITNFNNYVKTCLENSGKEEFRGTLRTIKIRKPTKSIEVIDENLVPTEFKKIKETMSIDKAEIKKTIKNLMTLGIQEILETEEKESKELEIENVLEDIVFNPEEDCTEQAAEEIRAEIIHKLFSVKLVNSKTSLVYGELK